MTAAPIGMLTRKIQCQLSEPVSTPPRSTPILPPPAMMKPMKPIALARAAGSVNMIMINDSETTDTAAPPRPCIARATTRDSADVARPQASEAQVNTVRPIKNRRRWPKKSPIRPARSKNPPKVSM